MTVQNPGSTLIGAVEKTVFHRTIGGVNVYRAATLRLGTPIARQSEQPLNEIRWFFEQRARIPTQLVGRYGLLMESIVESSIGQ